ncbi:MAG TPA: tripartite tricarboxylate transporter substrate binding protein [Burkholderiales bacterium]|jgi:tripartite-type tricarboxylate transporter receptor subunit TctC|nr:tripartite tricarboxylate transporter substrate binding protein [Burkholderiales bacterium]
MHWWRALGRIAFSITACALAAGVPAAEPAAFFPSRPIRFIVPFPPGSGTDILGRIISQEMSNGFKQPVVVDNRPGASTIIGTDITAKSAPDGYTVVMASNSHAINSSLFPKLPFDPVKDFAAVGQVAVLPFILVVNADLPARNLKDLIELARQKPGQLGYASTGNGTPPHVAGASLRTMANIDIMHVPYKGSADAMTAVIGGTVPLMFANTMSVLPQIRAGKLRAIAVGSPQRIPTLPDLPTVAESGLPGFDVSLWAGVLAPAGTPKEIVDKLNAEIVRVLALPEVKKNFAEQGAEVRPSTPEQFGKLIVEEIDRLGKIARAAHMRTD